MSKKPTAAMLVLGFCFWMMPPAWADERDDKIKALEKKLQELDEKYRTLEKKLESQQKPLPPNEPSPTDESASEKASTLSPGYKDAFTIRSANSNFVAMLRGMLQVDSRTFVDDGGIKGNDTFTLRRARPILEGTVFRDFDFLFVPEFGGSGSPSIRYAYLNYAYNRAVQARIGKFKVPVSLEQLQWDFRRRDIFITVPLACLANTSFLPRNSPARRGRSPSRPFTIPSALWISPQNSCDLFGFLLLYSVKASLCLAGNAEKAPERADDSWPPSGTTLAAPAENEATQHQQSPL